MLITIIAIVITLGTVAYLGYPILRRDRRYAPDQLDGLAMLQELRAEKIPSYEPSKISNSTWPQANSRTKTTAPCGANTKRGRWISSRTLIHRKRPADALHLLYRLNILSPVEPGLLVSAGPGRCSRRR